MKRKMSKKLIEAIKLVCFSSFEKEWNKYKLGKIKRLNTSSDHYNFCIAFLRDLKIAKKMIIASRCTNFFDSPLWEYLNEVEKIKREVRGEIHWLSYED